jgi:hypothetical protein
MRRSLSCRFLEVWISVFISVIAFFFGVVGLLFAIHSREYGTKFPKYFENDSVFTAGGGGIAGRAATPTEDGFTEGLEILWFLGKNLPRELAK